MANTLNLGNGNWATKEDSLLAYNSENGNFKPLPFDFTRASSATVVNKAGLIETVGSGEPRIDFSNDAKGALLLEPTRSNLITNSEKFVDAPIGNTNMDLFSGAITNNDTTSPNGNVTAMKFTIGGTSSSLLRIYQSDLSTSSDNTFSIYAKKGTANSLSIDITDVTVVNSILTDEWQRISVTNTSTSSKFIDVEVLGNVGEYIYIFGLQLEQGSYATSYIPTQGSAVTRVADVCNNGGNSTVFNSINSSGVLYFKMKRNAQSGIIASYLSISDATANNYISLYTYLNGNLDIDMSVGGIPQYSERNPISVTWTNLNKIAIRWKANELTFWVNGVSNTVTSIGTGLVFSSSILSILNLGFFNGGSPNYSDYSEIKVLTYQTNEEMVALTS